MGINCVCMCVCVLYLTVVPKDAGPLGASSSGFPRALQGGWVQLQLCWAAPGGDSWKNTLSSANAAPRAMSLARALWTLQSSLPCPLPRRHPLAHRLAGDNLDPKADPAPSLKTSLTSTHAADVCTSLGTLCDNGVHCLVCFLNWTARPKRQKPGPVRFCIPST